MSSLDFTEGIAEELPGVKKKSFVLPFDGGEIWFEHLDGIYQFTDLAFKKLTDDSRSFLAPSKPSQIGFVLNDTEVTEKLVQKIAAVLCESGKKFTRVCFIGSDRRTQRQLRRALKGKSDFFLAFMDDFEKAKEWLISERSR